jgi:hypothetical protein
MYYKRQLPVMSGVYRPLETRRFVMMTMGGYWPIINQLPNGHLGVVTRDGDFHSGQRGRLVFVTSPDGGESWSHASVISADGMDNRNPAFGVAPDGTLLASFIKAVNYKNGVSIKDRSRRVETSLYISRSEDNGETWSTSLANVEGQQPSPSRSPFGRMVNLEDGTILMAGAINTTEPPFDAAVLIRSHDGGRTWVDLVKLGDGYGEAAVVHVGGDRFLAMLRGTTDFTGLAQIDSNDGGYTWTEPRRITANMEHPGDVIRLLDGRLLLTYGRRVTPWGIQGMISTDDGKTWDGDNRILLTADSGIDQGYPSTIQRGDGTIVTVYYSSELHISRRPRPEILGIHGAAVIYRPEDL